MMQENPFALFKASDYTDEQINSLWVELGSSQIISQIIEPKSGSSKFILGGKGTGKTHLLRYYSYPVVRLRAPNESGIDIIRKHNFLAVFLRATAFDAARFEATAETVPMWQQLFGIYFELRLAESVLDALCDIRITSPNEVFSDSGFIEELKRVVTDESINTCLSVEDVRSWAISQRRAIDDAVNNAAFTGKLDVKAPFSIGSLSLPLGRATRKWHESLNRLPLIYLIDEVENFSFSQQQVINTLIRYGEGLATFRVTGRRYAVKTHTTLANGEENRENSEFRTTFLDDILLKEHSKFSEFAHKFVIKRLQSAGFKLEPNDPKRLEFNPKFCFEEISTGELYSSAVETLNLASAEQSFKKSFIDATTPSSPSEADLTAASTLWRVLTDDLPLIIKKLNILLFFKKMKKSYKSLDFAKSIREDAETFVQTREAAKEYYSTAYGHYANDIFAQLCRESETPGAVPYAGFDNFVKMASGNPRSLLTVLGKAYEIAAFKGLDFINGAPLPVSMQTEAAHEAVRFMYESDTNFGSESDLARTATTRLATVLRTARYALNIPEVSPLAVSFSEADLTDQAKRVLQSALNYSFVFEISDGRPDRNSQKVNRKIQLNPLLSPKWGLPLGRRGDLSLNRELLCCIFDTDHKSDFDLLLRTLNTKWNSFIKPCANDQQQGELF